MVSKCGLPVLHVYENIFPHTLHLLHTAHCVVQVHRNLKLGAIEYYSIAASFLEYVVESIESSSRRGLPVYSVTISS